MADEYTPRPNDSENSPETPQPPVPPQYPPVPPAQQPVPPAQAPYTPPQNAGQYNYYQQQPGYTPPYYSPAPGPQIDPAKGKATASLVLGIISLVCCGFIPLPIIGLVLGLNAKSLNTPSSGMATAGIVLNTISLVFSAISICLAVFNWGWTEQIMENIYGFCRLFL